MSLTDTPAPAARPSLYRVLWRWHFYAGVLVTPVLLVVAVTGALYVFKDELEAAMHSAVLFAEPGPSRVSLDAQVAAAKASVPDGYRADSVRAFAEPGRATEVFFLGKGLPFKSVYVSPYTGAVQGEIGDGGFFRTVLKLHRTLFLGITGRVLVELTTGWCVVLLTTGLYLWWPRGRPAAGVLYPRLRAKPYVVLRDLHTVAGFWLLPVALCVALTGFLYTQVWGTGYRAAADRTGAFAAFRDPPKSTSPPDARPLPLDDAFAVARSHYPDATSLSVTLPAKPDAGLMFFARGDTGPTTQGTLVLDRSTGEVLADTPLGRVPALGQWSSWNYPLHVGSVLGTPTKVVWLAACVVLAGLPVTGLWMWWTRRPAGRTGLPKRPAVRLPAWLVGVIVLLGVLLPVVGASVVLILLGEWAVGRVGRRRAALPDPVAMG